MEVVHIELLLLHWGKVSIVCLLQNLRIQLVLSESVGINLTSIDWLLKTSLSRPSRIASGTNAGWSAQTGLQKPINAGKVDAYRLRQNQLNS